MIAEARSGVRARALGRIAGRVSAEDDSVKGLSKRRSPLGMEVPDGGRSLLVTTNGARDRLSTDLVMSAKKYLKWLARKWIINTLVSCGRSEGWERLR